jgi:ketosteroid isomerase-like protein
MLKALMLLLFTVTCSLPGTAQSGGTLKFDLETLHSKWLKAYDAGDGATMDRMEVSNLILVMPSGQIWTKSGPSEADRKGYPGAQRTLSDAAVRQFGNTAILTGILATNGAQQGNGHMATTVVFVRSGGTWMIASAQWCDASSSK